MKNWSINFTDFRDVLRKLGIYFIAGGIVALVFDKKIDEQTAFITVICGVAFVFIGLLNKNNYVENES